MPPIFYKGDSQNPDFNSLADLRDRLKELLTRDQAEFLLSMQGRQKVQQELKRRAKRALNGTMVDLGLHSQWGKGAYKAYKAAAEAVLKRKQQPADRAQDSSSRVTSAGLSLSGPGGLIAALLGLGVLAGGGYALSQFTDIRESYGNRRLA
jgi:hypothetical protein